MILTTSSSLVPGMTLGKPVYNDQGRVLIGRGIPVTQYMIDHLQQLGISYVYLEDERTDDIIPHNSISENTRIKAFQTIRETFTTIHKEQEKSTSMSYELIDRQFSPVIKSIINDMKFNNDAISLLSDVFSFDDHIYTHSLDVAVYSLALGMALGLNESKLIELGLGAILHDIGKIKLPKTILQKKEKLNDDEFHIVKFHTDHGFEMLRKSPNISLLTAHCAYQHHERLDGTGYPRGLKGNEIHLYSKIVAITDVFDAVTTNRVYRKAMLPHEGLELLFSGSDTLFDNELLRLFRQTVSIYPNGMPVKLNDGRIGIVSGQNRQINERPIIRILQEEEELKNTYEVNLAKELDLIITSCGPNLLQTTTTIYS